MEKTLVTLTSGKNYFTFDQERAGTVCSYLAQAWRNQEKFYSQCVQPEVIFLPSEIEYGSLDHALFLFAFAEINRAGNSTAIAMEKGAPLFAKYRWMIDPNKQFNRKIFEKEMVKVMSYVSTTTPKGIEEFDRRIQGWRDNLNRLRKYYDGDPRNIFFNSERTRQSLIGEIMKFYGFGHKVSQLMIIWFQDINWPENQNDWVEINQIPAIPADMWVERAINNLGILVDWSCDHREAASLPVSDFLVDVCIKYEIDWSDLSQALWHLGSTICKKVPKHRSRVYCSGRCPAYDMCEKRTIGSLHTRHNKGRLRWDKPEPHHRLLFPEFEPKDLPK